jgi:hypothetical protein
MDESLVRLEADLRLVQGVSSARIVGEKEPSEIHIVASTGRPPKQIVRDVQSLATARFGIAIDHRIVSVVQLDQEPPSPAARGRAVLDRVVLASKGHGGWVKVALQWPDGEATEGAGAAGSTREARARGATLALIQALDSVIAKRAGRLDADHVGIIPLGPDDTVVVRAIYSEGGSSTTLVGCAVIHDDVATAAVRALLQAINRRLGRA